MRALLARTSIGVAGALLASLLLAGCSPTPSAAPTTSDSAQPSPSTSPSASATPAASADLMFTISANVRGKDGSTIGITMTAHKPLPYSSSDVGALQKEFLATCGPGVQGTPVTADTLAANGSILMSIDLASSVKNKPFVYPLDVFAGKTNFYGQSVKGTGIKPVDPSAPCDNGYTWSTAGPAHAVADFESGIPGPTLTQWRYGFFGFSVPFDSKATIEACTIKLEDAAATVVTGDGGWDPNAARNGISCGIGYVGE
ncbi:hypothetical protein [Glaciihabitans sp. UYNi722]|uniref:hypothetical protein n=1 Tax=Glaciihabitans sp. UYNi722 TaxID=3156344 RepID=UPI0033969AA4